ILIGLLSLACISSMVVAIFILSRQQVTEALPLTVSGPVQPTHTVTYTQVTGLNGYTPAKTAAQSWAEDAQLVWANTTWPKIITVEQVGEPTSWTYRFYSPAKARFFFVTVAPDGQVETIEHQAQVSLPPGPIAPDSWLIDSPTALAIWLDNGGETVLRNNPGLEMVIQLRSVNNSPNPVWLVVGLNKQTEEIHAVVIDANQGTVTATKLGS
ncbi:MAG TPA: hypothetical protein VEC93_15320, partial [Anaerolineae bacterium]|nr:hypothetical protein [Anaerolineae bacterium]